MKLEYSITEKDLINMYRYQINKIKGHKFLTYLFMFFLVLSFLMIPIILISGIDVDSSLIVPFVMINMLYVFLIVFLNEKSQAKRTLKRNLKAGILDNDYISQHSMELDESKITIKYATYQKELSFAGIQKIEEFYGGILIYSTPYHAVIIPASAFENLDRQRDFYNNLINRFELKAREENLSDEIEKPEIDYECKLEFVWDKEQFIDSFAKGHQLIYRTRLGWTNGQIICTAVSVFSLYRLFGIFNDISFDSIEYSYKYDLIPPIFIIFMIAILNINVIKAIIPPFSKAIIARLITNNKPMQDFFHTQVLYVMQDRFIVCKQNSKDEILFGRIYCMKEDNNTLYVLFKDKSILFIPKSAFQTNDERNKVVEFINAHTIG